jgi:UPF0716 protein FxsA
VGVGTLGSVLVLFLAFLVVPVVEIYVLVQVGATIGALNTVGLLLLVSLVGAWVVKHQGTGTWRRIRGELAMGRMPGASLVDGALIFAAGVLLLVPGFVTDAFGFLLLIPPVRHLVRALLARRFDVRVHQVTASGTRRTSGGAASAGSSARGEWAPPREPPAIDV